MTQAERKNHFNGEPWIPKNDDMTSEKTKNKNKTILQAAYRRCSIIISGSELSYHRKLETLIRAAIYFTGL